MTTLLQNMENMLGYPAEALALISLALLIGGVAKGITAVGLPIITISIVLTMGLMVPRESIALVVVPILITNLWQALRAKGLMDPINQHWPMIVAFLSFLFLGSQLLAGMDADLLLIILGACVSVFAASSLYKPKPYPLSPATQRWAGPTVGAVGGLLGGMTTIWGPPMMMYLVLLKLKKDEWVRTIGLVWFCGAVPLTAFYWANGVLNPSNVWLSTAACVPGMVGIIIGERIRKFIDEDAFRRVMLVLLFLIGLNLIRRAFF